MDFRLGLVSQLTGRGSVVELLEVFCRQMEYFLDCWKGFVAQKRVEYFYFNYYIDEQLVYLSIEFKREKFRDVIFIMLFFIKSNCSLRDIFRVCSGFDGRVISYQGSAVIEELRLTFFFKLGLLDKLRVIMEQSMICMSVFLFYCLDLEVFGYCLVYLARMGGFFVERQFLKGLQVGQFNFVVCGYFEVLSVVLVIYMQILSQFLFSYDEVLFCISEITFEEVALFLRRCLILGFWGYRVYSLLYVDQLSYDVVCQVEVFFQSLRTQRFREDYQFVMVCDCEWEYCYFFSVFSQYKVFFIFQAFLEVIQVYLVRYYRVLEQISSAVVVFRDRMCVGIVVSERAGVGNDICWGGWVLYVLGLFDGFFLFYRGDLDEVFL